MSLAFYRFSVGSFECTSLSDGEHDYTLADMFANVPEHEVRKSLREAGMPDDIITTPYTYLHIDTGDRQLLVDAGAGKLSENTGRLLESMEAAEIDPAAVAMVIITHAHPDHIGGILADDRTPCFPNADYVISKREWDYWFSNAELDRAASDRQRRFFNFARSRLEVIGSRTRQIAFATGREEIVPGVVARPAFGHTPGHMVVELSSGGDGLVYTSDVVLTPIHLGNSSWLPVFDVLPEEAAESKRRIYDDIAARGVMVVGQHFWPFPSLGHVIARGDSWQWQPTVVAAGSEAVR